MTQEAKRAVRQVLREAADTPNFFDLSDGERLVRMIGMAFHKGPEGGQGEAQQGTGSTKLHMQD